MKYIKRLIIEGFKKFSSFQIEFNKNMNIIVGENEAGKSTILEALRVVLNQQYKNVDKSVLHDLFNVELIEKFRKNPCIENLPKIIIEVEFEFDSNLQNAEYFYGEAYGGWKKQQEKYGIRFECKFDEEIGREVNGSILEGDIPYEYYNLTWNTFANRTYQIVKRPISFIYIDTTSGNASTSFNYYNKALFNSKYNERLRMKAKNSFRERLNNAFELAELPEIDERRRFGIDSKKVILESVISVYEDNIPLENRGSGMESLIKTKIALDKGNGLDVILMEEPENHLSFSMLRKILQEISEQQDKSQIIVTTHSNMIASRLNLNNVLWIADNGVTSLNTVDVNIADFFVKADDNAFLQLLLSKKVILVEGATEFLLVPYFYQKMFRKTVEDDEISVISCNGISYKNYLEIAKATDKKIAVITDNDENQEKITEAVEFNESNSLQHIFMADDVSKWTWEVCIYEENKTLLEKLITIRRGAKYTYKGKDYCNVLGKMLNNKVDVAYFMLKSGEDFIVPQYVKEAIEWVRK